MASTTSTQIPLLAGTRRIQSAARRLPGIRRAAGNRTATVQGYRAPARNRASGHQRGIFTRRAMIPCRARVCGPSRRLVRSATRLQRRLFARALNSPVFFIQVCAMDCGPLCASWRNRTVLFTPRPDPVDRRHAPACAGFTALPIALDFAAFNRLLPRTVLVEARRPQPVGSHFTRHRLLRQQAASRARCISTHTPVTQKNRNPYQRAISLRSHPPIHNTACHQSAYLPTECEPKVPSHRRFTSG